MNDHESHPRILLREADPQVGKGRIEIRLATTFWSRLRGLARWPDYSGLLLLAPCRDIHTIGLKRPIDLAFVDHRGRVIASLRYVEPNRRHHHRHAVLAIERYASYEPWLSEGHSLGQMMDLWLRSGTG